MNRSGGFCPQCGTSLAPGEGHISPDPGAAREARLCPDCFREGLDLVSLPKEVTIRLCTSCGAVVENGEWVDTDQADVTDIAIERVGNALGVHRDATDVHWGVEPIQRGPNELDLHVSVRAMVDDAPVTAERTIRVRISRETCTRCGRIAGNSYAGTVQIRGEERIPTGTETDRAVELAHEVVDDMRETGDRDAFISEVTERPEGVDIRVSTTKIGAKVATAVTEELGGSYDTSETLVTEDEDGRGVYRVAYAVRLPRVRLGDIVDVSTGPVVIERATAPIEGHSLATGETIAIEESRATDATILGTLDDVEETTVVAVIDETSVQVLDPDTYETQTIRRPEHLPTDAETMHVFKHNGTVYPVPVEG